MKNIIDKKHFGPWALVSGASSGIGAGFARQLASAGINVVLTARRLSLLEKLGQELQKEHGISYHAVEADMSNSEHIEKILQVTNTLEVGLLVSNAGTGDPGEFIHKKEEDLLRMIDTSVIAHLKLTHHFSQKFAKARRGGVILVSAMGASHGLPFMSNDAGTRAYIRSFGLGLHEELKRYGVHLTVLITSPTTTPIVEHLGFTADKMPLPPLSVEKCVKETLKAFTKNKATIIPGRLFRAMNTMVPNSFSRKMFGKMLAEGNNIPLKLVR